MSNLINLVELSLDLAYNNIEDESIIKVFEIVVNLNNLVEVSLDLRNNGITNAGFN